VPVTFLESSTFDPTVDGPADGDDAIADSVNVGFQGVVNRTRYLYTHLTALNGLMRGGDAARCAPGSTDVIVSPLALWLGGVTLSAAGESTVSAAGLTPSLWYYLYAYNNAGALAFEISTTAPDAARVFMTGNATRRYLCTLRTHNFSGTTRPIPFQMREGRYVYRASAVPTGLLEVLAEGSSTVMTTVDLGGRVPPHARLAELRVIVDLVGSSSSAQIRTNGDTTDVSWQIEGETRFEDTTTVETNAVPEIQYAVGHNANPSDRDKLTLIVHGYTE
jgi:hypothetical protein